MWGASAVPEHTALNGLSCGISVTLPSSHFTLDHHTPSHSTPQVSYAIPILLRCTLGRTYLIPNCHRLGVWAYPMGAVSFAYLISTAVILLFPQVGVGVSLPMVWHVLNGGVGYGVLG